MLAAWPGPCWRDSWTGFGWYSDAGSGPGIIASIVGAIILLFLYRLLIGAGYHGSVAGKDGKDG